jgi:hypothetical protein
MGAYVLRQGAPLIPRWRRLPRRKTISSGQARSALVSFQRSVWFSLHAEELVGGDQQLAAIGASRVLRDVQVVNLSHRGDAGER